MLPAAIVLLFVAGPDISRYWPLAIGLVATLTFLIVLYICFRFFLFFLGLLVQVLHSQQDAARRSDYPANPMPASAERLAVEKEYPGHEWARLCFGVVPNSMEERWFIFYEEPWLCVHRNSNGECFFRVRFEVTGGGARIAEAYVNPGVWSGTRDDASGMLLYALETAIERNARYVRA